MRRRRELKKNTVETWASLPENQKAYERASRLMDRLDANEQRKKAQRPEASQRKSTESCDSHN